MSPSRMWRPAATALALLATLLAADLPLLAQATGTIRGRVVSTDARPLVGAQVTILGTGLGTLSNSTGEFILLNVPAGTHTVRAQILGYGTAETTATVTAGEAATVQLELSQTAIALDEVVVTGTAVATRKKEIGNAVSAVTAAEIATVPVRNPQEVLQGRTPGVTVMTNSGQPGAGGTIKIRGTNTVSQTTEPLIYVDGVRIFNEPTRIGFGARTQVSPLQDIAAEDIERIEVVKGAAATTLYGTEASAGVVQIFTKKGRTGAPVWNAELSAGFSDLTSFGPDDDPTDLYNNCANTEQLFGFEVRGKRRGERTFWMDPTCPADGTWTERGAQQNYSLSVRGGAERMTYFMSGNFGDVDGVLPTSNSKDGGFRGNFSFSPIEPLTFSLASAYTRRNSRFVGDGNNAGGFLLNVGRGKDGYFKGGKQAEDCAGVPSDVVCTTNAYLFEAQNFARTDHFTTGFTTQYNPTPSLANRFVVGWDYNDINAETTRPFGYLITRDGYFWDENTRHTKLSVDYAGSWQANVGGNLASTFSWGGQVFRDSHRWTEIDVETFAGPGEPTLETGAVLPYRAENRYAQTNAGMFLQEMIGLNDRLFLTAGLRVDGNSAFGDDFGLQPYPKLSAAYVLSEESFWPRQYLDGFKLRAAVGESGKAPPTFAKLRTWSSISGDEGQPGFTPSDIGNPDIGPERTREYEVGFDASLLTGRLGIEYTYFNARTFDALVPVQLPPSLGILASSDENIGELVNTGHELGINADLLRTSMIEVQGRANMTWLKSNAEDLGGEEVYTGLKSEIREGFPVPTYFGNKITNPDEFADPIIERDQAIGNVYPTRLLGFGATVTLMNNLSLDGLVEHQGGHYISNYTGYQNARRGVWQPCYDYQEAFFSGGDLGSFTALERARCSIDDYDSDFWLEKADFTKIRYLSLTYQLPAALTQRFANTASLTLAGSNLFTWTGYNGSDPEVEDATDRIGSQLGSGDLGRRDYYQIPPARTFLLSLRFSF